MLDSTTLVLVEEHVVIIRLLHLSLNWQNPPISIKFIASIVVQLRAAKSEIGSRVRSFIVIFFRGTDAELASTHITRLKIRGSIILTWINTTLNLEFRLSSKRYITLVPIESLVKPISYTSL